MSFLSTKRILLPLPKQYFMSLLAGIESGLATTTAIVAGLTISSSSTRIIVATALISMAVQAWNSAMVTISIEHTANQLDHPYSKREHYLDFISDGALQFFAHIFASLIPILPIVFIADQAVALGLTVATTLFVMFLLGFNKGRVLKRNTLRAGMEAVVPGALVIAVGILAGLALTNG